LQQTHHSCGSPIDLYTAHNSLQGNAVRSRLLLLRRQKKMQRLGGLPGAKELCPKTSASRH
jgi:hypothetical protein